jgi:hypothetical protein
MAHVQKMELVYQQLASQNMKISDKDYVNAIIQSLPQSYSNLMSSLLMIHDQMNTPIVRASFCPKLPLLLRPW